MSTPCAAICSCELKTFRYLQPIQRGDLTICIRDSSGPVIPTRIEYELRYIHESGVSQRIGPGCRTPSAGIAGEFYATGRAGESGRPGCWMIRWTFQKSPDYAVQTQDMLFSVQDAVAANDPADTLERCRWYGWS